MTGLGGALAVFVVLFATGIVASGRNPAILIVLEFLALMGAGYVAGRFAPSSPVAHGGLAGIALFLVAGAVSIALSPTTAAPELLVLGVIAAVLGSAGGAIAMRRSRD